MYTLVPGTLQTQKIAASIKDLEHSDYFHSSKHLIGNQNASD